MNSTIFQAFKQVALLVLTPHCFDNYFIDLNLTDVPCFKSTLSKGLGFGIILGSLLVKVPQIIKIFKSKSGEGINLISATLDLSAISIHFAYNFVKGFPFSSWGDTLFLGIQTVTISVLVLYYNGSILKSIAYLLTYLLCLFVLISGLTPVDLLWSLTTINIGIVFAGKFLQAVTNYKNGNTGQLSAITLIMLLGGSAARIFTSIQETGDLLIVITYIVSTLANTILVVQLLYYWNVPISKTKKE